MLDRQQREDDADQRHRRADREVEIARDDQHHGADRGEADDRSLQRQQDKVALGEERAVGGEIEEQPDRDEHKKQHRIAERRNTRDAPEQTLAGARSERDHTLACRFRARAQPSVAIRIKISFRQFGADKLADAVGRGSSR